MTAESVRIAEERSVLIEGPEAGDERIVLDALFRAGHDREAGGVVIAPPHPLYGGSMESPVVTELAYAAADAGLASLRFDWRGVGASRGRPSGDVADHAADFASAIGHLAESVEGPLCAAGYSAGAAAAVRASGAARVTRILLVAPPVSMLDAARLRAFEGRVLVVAGDSDRLASPESIGEIVEGLPRARLEVLAGTDHFFGAGLAGLGRIARRWLGVRSVG